MTTAYLLVILDENGHRKNVGIYPEKHPRLTLQSDTPAVVMEVDAPDYERARAGVLRSVRDRGGWLAWELAAAIASIEPTST